MQRTRISITVKTSLLKQIDQQIDGTTIRNRSHAIEYFLSQSLSPGVSKVAILAGGDPISINGHKQYKALLPISGRPILEHTLNMLQEYHLREVIVASGQATSALKEKFGPGHWQSLKLQYGDQTHYTGTGGALKALQPFIGQEPFVLMHGDIMANIDLQDMIEFHLESDYLITLALTAVSNPRQYGAVQVKRQEVVSFNEKPKKPERASHLINAGIYVVDPAFFDEIPTKEHCSLEKEVLPHLAQNGKVGAYVFDGKWLDISTPASYKEVQKRW